MSFSLVDAFIVVAYLIGVALFGVARGKQQSSARDYFVSERAVLWWAACFAIVATETSALTFLSIPGIAYAGNLNFLQLTFGYVLGRIVVATVFIPAYFRGELSTAYALLGERFGQRTRRAASIVFLFTRTCADAVRLYTTAIPLALLFKGFALFNVMSDTAFSIVAIVVISIVTLVYVWRGGVRAVIWTDVVQMFIYLIGAVAALWILLDVIARPFGEIIDAASGAGKLSLFNFGFDLPLGTFFSTPYTFIASILGGMFLSMASHGADHIIVQRVLTTNDATRGARAMILSGVIVMFQFALFLAIGVLLAQYYNGAAFSTNEVFARFIIEKIPSGVSGLIIAGLLAAAMSTLSGSISALASSTMLDVIVPLRKNRWDASHELKMSRLISIVWCVILMVVAFLFIGTPRTVVELALSIASFTYGGLLGLFLLGTLTTRVREPAALTGFAAGIITLALVITLTDIAWTWYTLIGSAATVGVASIVHSISAAKA